MGTVERVFVAGGGGQPMRPVDEVQAVAGRGLDGDRYATRRGYWTDVDECQVTLIAGEDLDAITESSCGRWPGGRSASARRPSPTTAPARPVATSMRSPSRA